MMDHYRSNIILTFLNRNELGEIKRERVTLNKVRTDLLPEEIMQVGDAFNSLIKHSLIEVELVQVSFVTSAE